MSGHAAARVASDDISYDARCPQGHVTKLTFRLPELREQLAQGTLVLYCAICDTARAPTPGEHQALLARTQSGGR